MRRNNKQITTSFIICSLLLIGVIYAILQANLQINGTAKIQANTWDIHFDNIQVNSNSVSIGENDFAATIDLENNCKVDFEVTLSIPGDFYEFTIDVVNAGTIDGMIGELNKTLKVNNEVVQETPDYLDYSVTYADGMEILENHKLEAGVTETYKVRLEFKTDIEELPEATTITTSLEPQYLQADTSSIVRPNVFIYGTWDQIVAAYNSGNIAHLQTAMEAGTTREVQLDMDNDGAAETTAHVRIANLSKPTECSTEGFSQTACGFVIEFADVIAKHRMNPYVYGDSNLDGTTVYGSGNKGSWEYSEMRAYLNSTIYHEGLSGEINYNSTGIYNMLPSTLKNIIINTKVVSGYGMYDSSIFTSMDKLYLLDGKELFGSSYTKSYDKAKDYERQLDFYFIKSNIISNEELTMKYDKNGYHSNWWLRSASKNDNSYFFLILTNGSHNGRTSHNEEGVSPAFRIAE